MSVIWINGRFEDGLLSQVSHEDAGFTNALGVFDSMLAENGVLIDARAHFDRLIRDVETVLGIGESWLPGFAQMSEAWLPLLEKNRLTKSRARLRTVITGGITGRPLAVSDVPTILISASIAGPVPDNPLACAIVRDFPRVAGDLLENCKRVDYTRSFAARRKAQILGADEAFLINTRGNIACGATSNLFIEERGFLVTPPLSEGVLAGTVRARLVSEGAYEENIDEARLRAADKIYLTNSFFGMRPALLID